MKLKKIIALGLFMTSLQTFAGGEGATNGGDSCENKIKTIALDIKQWINDGGAASLTFTDENDLVSYESNMLMTLNQNISISCVSKSLELMGVEKTCINYNETIECSYERFMKLGPEEQYILVHHEYAGLSGLEVNNDQSSDYFYSSQLSLFLEDKIVKRLAIKKSTFPDLEMSYVKAGDFIMNHSNNYYHSPGEQEHKVRLTKDFNIMKNEVTQALYFSVMGQNPSYFKNKQHCPDSWELKESKEFGFSQICPHHPVENVSKKDVFSFIKKLNELTGEKYRLPTEAEWEYAARGGRQTEYFYGDDESLIDNFVIYLGNSNTTKPVGKYRKTINRPNALGLYDVNGNVMEIVADSYTSFTFVSMEITFVDPYHYKDYEDVLARGGSFESNAYQSRLAHRVRWYRENSYKDSGFRLAK